MAGWYGSGKTTFLLRVRGVKPDELQYVPTVVSDPVCVSGDMRGKRVSLSVCVIFTKLLSGFKFVFRSTTGLCKCSTRLIVSWNLDFLALTFVF